MKISEKIQTVNYFILLDNCKQQEGVYLFTGQYLIDHQKATPS